jgi:D-alanyl-D-alanine carboxypeptidase/D-alanyl-D-alanine-endopeptidase (penicillin-binding protein 4)
MNHQPFRTVSVFALALGALVSFTASGRGQTLTPNQRNDLAVWYQSARHQAPGTWGIAVADQRGQILWGIEPATSLIPASTVKLFTTGFARTVVGGEARRPTRVVGSGFVDPATGEWMGNWALELNGDPSLENPSGVGPKLSDLAGQLAALGIRKISGPLQVRSADGPADASYPAAWSPRHWGRLFAPLIGALTIHENVVFFTVRPGDRVGRMAQLVGEAPAGVGALVLMRAKTVSGRRSRLRLSGTGNGGWIVSGTIGVFARARGFTAVAADPKAVLAKVWATALQQAGVQWSIQPRGTVRYPGPISTVLAEVNSPVFDSLASDVNRRSLNLGAELLLRWAGKDNGPELMTAHVRQVAGTSDGLHLVDGSGLSAEDRASPLTFVSYLAHIPTTPGGRNFPMLLPANGVGTLRRLNSGFPGQGVVRAKTGTLDRVSNVSGYLGRQDGVLIVSVMYNGSRPARARPLEWRLFHLLGGDGTIIPSDVLTPESQLGGTDESVKDSTR